MGYVFANIHHNQKFHMLAEAKAEQLDIAQIARPIMLEIIADVFELYKSPFDRELANRIYKALPENSRAAKGYYSLLDAAYAYCRTNGEDTASLKLALGPYL